MIKEDIIKVFKILKGYGNIDDYKFSKFRKLK